MGAGKGVSGRSETFPVEPMKAHRCTREAGGFNPHVFPATQQTGGHSIPQTLCTPGNSPDLSVGGEKIGQAHQVLLFCIYFHIEILLFYRALKNSTEMTNWHLETSFPASIGL